MALTVKQLVNRHGAFVSAVTALLVGVAIIVGRLLEWLIGAVSALSVGQFWDFPIAQVLILAVPFAVGFFVSLWIIAPIAEELRLPHVVTRAVLATGVASTVYFVVQALVDVIRVLVAGPIPSLPGIFDLSGPSPLDALGGALVSALSVLVSSLPLGILAGVLLWLWRKDHPSREPLSGLIDEV